MPEVAIQEVSARRLTAGRSGVPQDGCAMQAGGPSERQRPHDETFSLILQIFYSPTATRAQKKATSAV